MPHDNVIASFHLADAGPRTALRLMLGKPIAPAPPGLRYATMTTAVPLAGGLLPRPSVGRVGLIAAWETEGALDDFLASGRLAGAFAHGWSVRLQPTRVYGAWSPLDGLLSREQPMADDEPAAVLTIGRLRLTQAARFLRASAPAEELAVAEPSLLASTGLVRPPALVGTFSLWRSTAAMRAYSQGAADPAHRAAVTAHTRRSFHHESAFIRFRPYAARGSWGGVDPLADHSAERESSRGGISYSL
jgi:hypothetical protein